MKKQGRPSYSLVSLVSVVILYLAMILLVLFLATTVIDDITSAQNISWAFLLPIAVFLPLVLITTIIIQIFRLIREQREEQPGAKFKLQLVLFFTFLTLLSSIPQGFLAVRFTNSAVDAWFSPELGSAIEGGVNLALSYSQEIDNSLESVNNSNILQGYLRFIEFAPESIWNNIRDVSTHVHSIQIFYGDNRPSFFRGDPQLMLDNPPTGSITNGLLPKEFRETLTIQRVIKSYPSGGSNHYIVMSSLYPVDFTSQARSLTAAMRTYRQIEEFRTVYRTALVLFYSFFTIPVMLLSLLISFYLSDEIVRPIVNLERATRRVMDGDYSFRLVGRRNNVLSILVESFNNMIMELENSRTKLIQTEKVTAWQEIAQRLAHEIKNPLTPIKLSAERIRRKKNEDPEKLARIIDSSTESIIHEVEGLTHLLSEFRNFARMPALSPRLLNIHDLLQQCLSAYAEKDLIIDFSGVDPGLSVPADHDQMKIVFTNLLKNAIDAMNGSGSLKLQTNVIRKGNNRYCRIHIEDSGCGMSLETQKEIFHPYYTTKADGTGLGLPIVERIIFDHKGKIWLESEEGTGTTFFLDLPLEMHNGHNLDN